MARVYMVPAQPLHLSNMRKAITPGLKRAMISVGALLRRNTKYNLSNRILQVRSNNLRSSVGYEVSKIPAGWRTALFAGNSRQIRYARVQDKGGMTGRNHATRIPKSGYMTKAVVRSAPRIRELLHKFATRITRSH